MLIKEPGVLKVIIERDFSDMIDCIGAIVSCEKDIDIHVIYTSDQHPCSLFMSHLDLISKDKIKILESIYYIYRIYEHNKKKLMKIDECNKK